MLANQHKVVATTTQAPSLTQPRAYTTRQRLRMRDSMLLQHIGVSTSNCHQDFHSPHQYNTIPRLCEWSVSGSDRSRILALTAHSIVKHMYQHRIQTDFQ